MSKAQDYFSSAASSYQDRSESFPWSAIRRSEAQAIDDALGAVTGLSVLDLGCGAGFYAGRILEHGARRVVGADAVAAMIGHLPRGVEGVVGDAGTLRLGEAFDRVVSAGLLEFVPDPASVFATIAAHLSANGRAVILFPVRSLTVLVYQAFHLTHGVRIRLFDAGEIGLLANAVNLDVASFRRAGPFAGVAALVPRGTR